MRINTYYIADSKVLAKTPKLFWAGQNSGLRANIIANTY